MFTVRAKLVAFLGPGGEPSCHFSYKIGDEITYDGERFEGRICPGLRGTLIPDMMTMTYSGMNHWTHQLWRRHGGASIKDPGMAKYDGDGWRMTNEPPDPKYAQIDEIWPKHGEATVVSCADQRTLATFRLEPIDIAPGGFFKGDYMRELSVLEKIKAEPGLTIDDILNKYDDFERNVVYPKLSPEWLELALEEMAKLNYIELKDGKAYPKK